MVSSDIIALYESDSLSPDNTYKLCHDFLLALLGELRLDNKSDIPAAIDTTFHISREPFIRYLRNMVIVYKIKNTTNYSCTEGLAIFLGHMNRIRNGLHGPNPLNDSYSEEMLHYVKSNLEELSNLKEGKAKESIVTAYSPIVPYVGGAYIKKPWVNEPTKNEEVHQAAAQKMRVLLMNPAALMEILEHLESIHDQMALGNTTMGITHSTFPPCAQEYVHLCDAFHAATESALAVYHSNHYEGTVAKAIENLMPALREVPTERLEDDLLEETNKVIIGAGNLVPVKKGYTLATDDYRFDVRAVIANIHLQRRFRPSAYSSAATINLPAITRVISYDGYLIIEPAGNADMDDSNHEVVYIPAIDDLARSNEVVLKCWKDGSRIEVLGVPGFRNEMITYGAKFNNSTY